MANKLIDPAPIIKKLADRCLEAKGIECSILGDLIDMLKAAPAENMTPVDAVEVVHGRWIMKQEPITWCEDDVDVFWECSICQCRNFGESPYCPNCGAKMDGDGNAT